MKKGTQLIKIAEISLPVAKYHNLNVTGYMDTETGEEALAIFVGNLHNKSIPYVRINSQCLFGEVFHSLTCDCYDQLQKSLEMLHQTPPGILFYLFQEGRGAGLANKMKGYKLTQNEGLDTVQAYERLHLPIDQRDYKLVIKILKQLKVHKIKLLTNNPRKVDAIDKSEIEVVKRIPIEVKPNKYNLDYLKTKKSKMHHLLEKV